MKRFAESIRYMCSDEDGKFRMSELVGGILFALLIPTLWVLLYAIGCN